jgi:hypothetical protein
MTAFAVTLAVGVLVLFVGFLVATSASAPARAASGSDPPPARPTLAPT